MAKSQRGGRRPGAGRPPPDPALVARVIELHMEGMAPRQIAAHPDIAGKRSARSVYLDIAKWRARTGAA